MNLSSFSSSSHVLTVVGFLTLGATAPLGTGCSDSGGGSGGTGGGTTTTGTGTSKTSTTSTATSTGSTTSTGTAMTKCGTSFCTSTQYCKDASGQCGAGPAAGLTCIDKPTVCSDGLQACGCDGMVYSSETCAQIVGVDLDVASKCTVPGGAFACGGTYCNDGSYCQIEEHADSGMPTTYSCNFLPNNCGATVTCGCLPNCGSGPQPPPCTIDASGNATQHCFTG